jgi:hypothetical protein
MSWEEFNWAIADYSDLKFLTGLVIAAFHACLPTVFNAYNYDLSISFLSSAMSELIKKR